jgi:DNA-binding transcriptional ArsR family regulator
VRSALSGFGNGRGDPWPSADELCGCDLGWITGQSDKVVSHHLSRLRREGLVGSRRDGKVVFASLTERGGAVVGALERVIA